MRPQFLKKGDTVGVIAIASAAKDEQLAAGWKEELESWGLKVKIGEHLAAKTPGDFAGTDAERTEDLIKMAEDPEIKAVLSIRGGYGTMRTLDHIDLNIFKKYPKWYVGFSDITILHYALQSIGMESIHGAMPGTFEGDGNGESRLSLKNALFGKTKSYVTLPHKYNKNGSAEGKLAGGNLTLMRNLINTPYDNDFSKPTILFIEDVSEKMYTIDSKLWHLRKCGHLDKCQGIIVGYFSETLEEKDWNRSVYDLINEYTFPLNIPVMYGLPCGHEDPNVSLYLGRNISLDVGEEGGRIAFL